MAAYAALVSLMHIIDQIQNHPHRPISLDKAQVESLTAKLTFLQEFLEGYSHVADYTKEADELEIRIAGAAYAAQAVIESHIVDQIRAAGSTSHDERKIIDLYEFMQKMIEAMDYIMKQAVKMGLKDQQLRNPTMTPGPLRSSSNTMVGFDDALAEIVDKLVGGQSYRQIIPIVGMGGIGKTTLITNVYADPRIKDYFDICAWATISQEYDAREILRQILSHENKEGMRNSSESELGEMLHKHLWGRRYLIVMDDMWSIEAWDEASRFLPDNKNGSRIVITTRLSNLAFRLTDSYHFRMKFLDEDKSWNLLCKTVFGEKGCPLELEKIGKEIAKNCKGLPLSIVVIGGLLAKLKYSTKYWEDIVKNLNSLVNSVDDEHCLKVLYMSYKQLPVHLKPCFLYMGVFREDHKIRANMLIRLWVAEGFLKPVRGKSLEEVAKDCLDELISINLVHADAPFGKIKYCSIHDLLRDLCLREANKKGFRINVKGIHNTGKITSPRIDIHGSRSMKKIADLFRSRSLGLPIKYDNQIDPQLTEGKLRGVSYPLSLCSLEDLFELVNSRYFDIRHTIGPIFPSAVKNLWNLPTLIVYSPEVFTAPLEIWMMPQLRHVKFHEGLYLPDPPSCCIDKQDNAVLSNLQSLSKIMDFKCGEEVLKRIPNIKKLTIQYSVKASGSSSSRYYCLNNLDRLHKLESFRYRRSESPTDFLQNVRFPHSLKKLDLDASHVPFFDDIVERIGTLPLLEVLSLQYVNFRGCIWETIEGQFCRLKVLRIECWTDLEIWNTESTHFPCLEHLVLLHLHELKEIPLSMAEIPTLQSIYLQNCSFSIISSAKTILEEQENLLGEVTLQVEAISFSKEDAARLKSLASPNFQVISYYDSRRRLDRTLDLQVLDVTDYWIRDLVKSMAILFWNAIMAEVRHVLYYVRHVLYFAAIMICCGLALITLNCKPTVSIIGLIAGLWFFFF